MGNSIEMTAMIKSAQGKGEILKREIEKLVAQTRKESGCIEFKVFQHEDNSDSFILWEIFSDKKALQLHMQQEYTKRYFDCVFILDTKVIKHIQI